MVITQASKTVLKIGCKSFSLYIEIKGLVIERFDLRGPRGLTD